MRTIYDINRRLEEVRAGLKAEAALQEAVETGRFVLSTTLGSKRLDRSETDGNVCSDALNAALAKVARPGIRDLLDLAGDELRREEQALGDELILTAASIARRP